MKFRHILVVAISIMFYACDRCDSVAPCAPPPDGPFVFQNVNFAFTEDVLENRSGSFERLGSLLGVSLLNENVVAMQPEYRWQIATIESSFSGFLIQFEENEISIPTTNLVRSNFTNGFANGGYVVSFYKEGNEFFALINFWGSNSQDWSCDDSIDC